MNGQEPLGPSLEMEVLKLKNGALIRTRDAVAVEIPFTIEANGREVATLLCSPVDLRELAAGFLFTSGFIASVDEIKSYSLDTARWTAFLELAHTPQPSIMEKRLYTSGCGKGVLYTSVSEIAHRAPLRSSLRIAAAHIVELTRWLQQCSALFRTTGSVHTAALSLKGETPQRCFDDVGRHNAVDKVIGSALFDGVDFTEAVLVSSGRTSSEILHKARACGIAITVSRGAPTHQTVLRAGDMGMTVIGFARSVNFTVYSHDERIEFTEEKGGGAS